MAQRNSLEILGFASCDPSWQSVPGEVEKILSFRCAVNESISLKGGEKKNYTTFYVVKCRGKMAEIVAKIVRTGSQLLIEGRPQAHAWVNDEGQWKATITISARDCQILGTAQPYPEPLKEELNS